MNPKKLILIGGGGHCKSVLAVLEDLPEYEIVGILDLPENVGMQVLSTPVIGSDNDIRTMVDRCDYFLITVGQISSSATRVRLFNEVKAHGGQLATIVASTANVSKHAELGEGTVVMHHALVNAAATVGLNCIINTGALVEHDATVGDHCHLSTSSVINGSTWLGSNSFVGSKACVIDGLSLGKDVIVGAGTTVITDLPDGAKIVGYKSREL